MMKNATECVCTGVRVGCIAVHFSANVFTADVEREIRGY